MNDAQRITSRDNQHLKFARRVRDRKEPDHIFIEGKRLCREALTSGIDVKQIFISDKFGDGEFDRFNGDATLYVVSDDLTASIADTDTPQGIVMIARRPVNKSLDEIFENFDPKSLPVWVCLERTNNPSNLGAVIRTAEAAGVRGVIVSSGSVDPFAPKCLRASMGSAFRLAISWEVNVSDVLRSARSRGITIAAMDAAGDQDHLNLDWTEPMLLVMGSEADGLSRVSVENADTIIRIKMKEPVESLNLAVSAGVVLFEAVRQNRLANR